MAKRHLFRAVDDQELQDVAKSGKLRPGPPSYQGKWFAESARDAARWGLSLFGLSGEPFYLLEVVVEASKVDRWFRLAWLDRIGPARFADPSELADIEAVQELLEIPVETKP